MAQHYDIPTQTQNTPSLSQSPSTITSNSSSPCAMTEINAGHYQYLLQDDIDSFCEQVSDLSDLSRKSDNASILHIAASIGQNERMIKYIVEESPSLLARRNSKGDLPVHIAVRAGHLSVVRNLVGLAYKLENYSMLEQANCEKNTALHIALENQQKGMAEYLFEVCPQVYYSWNLQKICPLYLAIKAGFWELVGKMIESENHLGSMISNDGLLNNKYTVIHAVIMAQNKGILQKLLEKYPNELLYSTDQNGRRPLSYAAYIGFIDGVNCIINMKDRYDESNTLYRNQVFKADNDGSFPIHMACRGGQIQLLKELLFEFPEKMSWLLNQKGQSILHVAAQSGKGEIVDYLLRQEKHLTMFNMKDEDGYTPLHLGVLGRNARVVYNLTWNSRTRLNLQCKNGLTALDLAESYGDVPSFEERLIWLALIYAGVPRAPQVPQLNFEQDRAHVTNGLVLYGKTSFIAKEQGLLQVVNHPKKHKNKYKERINTLLIISTLIATVTFASGFTVPGGYNNSNPKQGLATLDHKFAFQVFVITNTIAMYSSILAIVTLIWAQLDDLRLISVSLGVALPLLGTALGTMSIAFMAGLHVVLCDLFWLSVVVLVMGGVFLSFLLVFFIPLYSPTTCIKYRAMRYVFHVPFKLMLFACKKDERQ